MYIAQILYAYTKAYYIRYDISSLKYTQRCFVVYLIKIIDRYNNTLPKITYNEYDPFILGDWSQQIGGVTRLINSDYISKFKCILIDLNINKESIDICPYIIPFDITNTILVHLRLDDVENMAEISGKASSDYYSDIMNNDKNIFHINTSDNFNQQSPLSIQTIQRQLDIVSKKYPEKEIIIITNPGANLSGLPYRYISSPDENNDLYMLSQSKIIILSRSTYSLSSLFFGDHDEVYIPLIGFLVMFGLRTKFDRSNYIYF
jgi:hypothetical protein